MDYADNNLNGLVATVRLPENGKGHADPAQLGPLSLAYMGDTVYDLYVRTMLLDTTTLTAHGLHQAAVKLVCAKAQAAAFRRIEPMLTEQELAVFRRGRNTHIGTVPHSASIIDYRIATGLEAMLGWLYLSGDDGRIRTIMSAILSDDGTEIQQQS
ncbi:MAG: ribonuclease III [Clostridia bacterium]|jgi:ribonuclease-3 family protein|nr:ribonuclease III [Clostridia bacterium]